MPESRLEYLFTRYIQNNYTAQEEEELMALLSYPENQAAVQDLIDQVIGDNGPETQMHDQAAARTLQNIFQWKENIVVPVKSRRTVLSAWVSVAAAVIIITGGVIASQIFGKNEHALPTTAAVVKKPSPIMPAGNKAVLTRSDGSRILLEDMQNGELIQKGSARISKQPGLLIYKVLAIPGKEAPPAYDTLSTPRGGQYQLVLSDGTRVWLNAASSLYFPSVFTGNKRVVVLTGEAYFEVAKNTQKPFLVNVGDMQIKVLGTHFNVNAYSDESAVKTSLLEGSVRISKGDAAEILKPGQQAVLIRTQNKAEVMYANLQQVMAWKNGLFQFEDADITTIMREIGRWYNVEIVYQGKVSQRKFQGKISRNAELSDVLRILELSNLKFEVAGRKIIVK